MKLYICFIAGLILTVLSISASAQSQQQKRNDSVFMLVKQYFNYKDADAIYSLAGEVFKKALNEETFRDVAQRQLFPAGQIQESALISFVNNKMSTYKLTFNSGTLQLQMTLDADNKLELFLFKPYKERSPDKLNPVVTSNPMHTPIDKKVDSVARAYIQKGNTVGLSIGIIRNGTTSIYNYGETKLGSGKMPYGNTIFEIGALTKTFTATLLAYYVNEGKIKFTDPVTKYLPDSIAANKDLQAVTLVSLINHTSGLTRLPDNFEYHSTDPLDPYKDYTEKDLFEYLKTCKPVAKPGDNYVYSNLGISLLGLVLEKVSGQTFEQMVEDIICTPLGMSNTVQHIAPAQLKRFVTAYNAYGKETPAWNYDVFEASGAFKSTINDLLLFAQANLSKVDTKLSKAIELTHRITFDKDPEIAVGWHIIIIDGIVYYFHSSSTSGSSSFLAFNSKKNIAVVVLSNAAESVDSVGSELIKKIQ